MLARAFCSEPNCSTLPEIRPEMETKFIDWLEFFNYWMDHCSTNGLSVIALDKENCRVAGVFIVRDLLMIPPGTMAKTDPIFGLNLVGLAPQGSKLGLVRSG